MGLVTSSNHTPLPLACKRQVLAFELGRYRSHPQPGRTGVHTSRRRVRWDRQLGSQPAAQASCNTRCVPRRWSQSFAAKPRLLTCHSAYAEAIYPSDCGGSEELCNRPSPPRTHSEQALERCQGSWARHAALRLELSTAMGAADIHTHAVLESPCLVDSADRAVQCSAIHAAMHAARSRVNDVAAAGADSEALAPASRSSHPCLGAPAHSGSSCLAHSLQGAKKGTKRRVTLPRRCTLAWVQPLRMGDSTFTCKKILNSGGPKKRRNVVGIPSPFASKSD